jgi:hypothetical protein
MCSSQFNLTRMFLNSLVTCFLGLMILFHLFVNCLRVVWIDCLYVCCVCFDCASHQWCTVGIYCASAASKWPCFQRKKGFFSFFFNKKMAWRQAWREADVRSQTSAPPHLTVWRQPRQLRVRASVLVRESRSVIHSETEINSCVRVDVRLDGFAMRTKILTNCIEVIICSCLIF